MRMVFATSLAACFAMSAVGEQSIGEFLAKPSLNVVITVQDMDKAVAFYGDVLGLEPMPPIPFGDQTAEVFFPTAVVMQRFKVGTHEIKLIPGTSSTKLYEGGVDKGIGLRMVNYPIADIDAFKARLEEHGYPEPEINAMEGSPYRFGLMEDPDGNTVEFYYYEEGGPPNWEETIHIALTVSDVEASRKFYGEVLGLTALPAVAMPGDGRDVHLFMCGPTIIKFWRYDGDLPNRAGRHLDQFGYRYIQYATKDIRGAHDWVKNQGATVELPPTAVGSMPAEIMFVADPDGIINEMFGIVLPGE
jgi:lactoylglutathione lyase